MANSQKNPVPKENQTTNKKQNQKHSPIKDYVEYSGLGFQMLAIMLGGYFLGDFLDSKFTNEGILFTAIFTLLAIILSIFSVIRKLIK